MLPVHRSHFSEAQLCTNAVIERYFGHWIRDGLLLEILAAQRSLPALRLAGNPWLHEPGYGGMCGLDAARKRIMRNDQLWVIDDRGINDGRVSRFQEIRGRVRSAVVPNGTKRLMLARGGLPELDGILSTMVRC